MFEIAWNPARVKLLPLELEESPFWPALSLKLKTVKKNLILIYIFPSQPITPLAILFSFEP